MGHTSDHLSERFRLVYSAPCYHGQLFNDLGFMGDTKCSQQILKEKRMNTHSISTFGWRRSCRRFSIPFHVYPAMRLLPQFLQQTSNNIGRGLMKGHHNHLAVFSSPITRLSHLIWCHVDRFSFYIERDFTSFFTLVTLISLTVHNMMWCISNCCDVIICCVFASLHFLHLYWSRWKMH